MTSSAEVKKRFKARGLPVRVATGRGTVAGKIDVWLGVDTEAEFEARGIPYRLDYSQPIPHAHHELADQVREAERTIEFWINNATGNGSWYAHVGEMRARPDIDHPGLPSVSVEIRHKWNAKPSTTLVQVFRLAQSLLNEASLAELEERVEGAPCE